MRREGEGGQAEPGRPGRCPEHTGNFPSHPEGGSPKINPDHPPQRRSAPSRA